MRSSGRRLAEVAAMLRETVCEGITTADLDAMAEDKIRSMGAIPAFKGYAPDGGTPFPSTICASPNEQVVHVPAADSNEAVVLEQEEETRVERRGHEAALLHGLRRLGLEPEGGVSEPVHELIHPAEEALLDSWNSPPRQLA